MLTNHYNTLSKPISPKSICCISLANVSLYRPAGERSYLSLSEVASSATSSSSSPAKVQKSLRSL